MKKLAIASLLAVAATSASAVEVGVTGAYDYAGDDRAAAGLTVSQPVGPVTLTAGFDRATTGVAQNRWSVLAGYNLAKVGPVTLTAKAGGAYLDNASGADGFAWVVGAGASVPVTKKVAATVDVTRQYGQERVSALDGNRVTVGLKYSF